MDALFIGLILFSIIILVWFLIRRSKPRASLLPFPESWREILSSHVFFYKHLNAEKKKEFEDRMMSFLSHVRITGVKTTVEDLDRVLISSSAIIPIFGFPGWEYVNLNEVLLYPDSFNHDFAQQGSGRTTLGMVGDGPYNRVMILSKQELRQGFFNKTGKTNTAIHEFVHLVDKTDGSVDGIPEFFVDRQYVLPWLNLMRKEIEKIMNDNSDINPYGAINEGEFFAVAAEYFFENPELLENKHPELYKMLSSIFRQEPVVN